MPSSSYELNPYGLATLKDMNFGNYQDYDISVTLHLPRSPANLERGNFMLALHLLDDAPNSIVNAITNPLPLGPKSAFDGKAVLYSSTRPTIVPYTDPLVSLASRLLFLAYHIFFPAAETNKLVVPMVERLEFKARSMMPTSLLLDVQAGQTLQVYSVAVTITAQLTGLRWLMHTYWISSFIVFTSLFWLIEVIGAGLGWLALSYLIFGSGDKQDVKQEALSAGPGVKTESEQRGKNLDDIPMTFPTSSRQPPLRYEPPVNGLEDDDVPATPPIAGGEADDEDEDVDRGGAWRDSGIGTSYSDRDGADLRRRPSSRTERS